MKLRLVSYNTHGLPWSNQKPREISDWCLQQDPDVVCLQEVFTDKARKVYTDLFCVAGYTAVVPRDYGVTFFPSGLLTLVRNDTLKLVTERFEPFLAYDTVEVGANKGFQCMVLYHREAGRMITLVNTHTQSTTAATIFTSHEGIQRILHDQMEQMVTAVRKDVPAFLIGDFNCEASPHRDVRFFYPAAPLRKSTFPETGEDLDHIAWLPLQWTHPGRPWCNMDTTGPRILSYSVTPLPYSDHYPILVDVYVPAFPVQKARECLR
jgi:exonuclease III